MKPILLKAMFSLVLLLAFLAILEGVLRTTHLFGARLAWTEPDSQIGWRYTAGRYFWDHHENDHPITGHINNHGWRDRDREVEKPGDGFRVAVIGDSMVEAFQVELDSTFTMLAERRLREATGEPVEVMNFGRSGSSQGEQFLVLQNDVAPFEPDLVVLFFFPGNDVREMNPRTTGNEMRPYYSIGTDGELDLDTSFNQSGEYRRMLWVNGIRQRSALFSLLREKVVAIRSARVRKRRAASRRAPVSLTATQRLCTSTPDSLYVENYRINKRLLREMDEFCADRGMGFLLVCVSWFFEPHHETTFQEIDPTFSAFFFERDLEAHADSLGMDYLGLQTPFREDSVKNGAPLNWSHWNYAGHRLVADLLSQEILEIRSGE